jgi:hypothetical protein
LTPSRPRARFVDSGSTEEVVVSGTGEKAGGSDIGEATRRNLRSSNGTGSIALMQEIETNFHNTVKAFLYGFVVALLAIGLAQNRTLR